MNTAWIIVSVLIGAVMGTFYFGGLWFTVRRVATAGQPALLLLASFLVRLGVVLIGFYLLTDGHWERPVACLVGLLIARTLLIRRLRDLGADTIVSIPPVDVRGAIK